MNEIDEYEDVDLARLAMAIDCEGGAYIAKVKDKKKRIYYAVNVSIYNDRYTLVDWAQYFFGASITGVKRKNGKVSYNAHWSSKRASDILKLILPYMMLKQEQAKLCIELQATISKLHAGRHNGVPPEILLRRENMHLRCKELNNYYPQPA